MGITQIAPALDWTVQGNPVLHHMILVTYDKNTVLFEMNAIFTLKYSF